MLSYFSKYWFDFVYVMTLKEIKARYKRVFLGFIWVILNPILQMLVIGFVFQFFIPVKIDNYFYFLFSGLLPWNFFSYTIIKCTPLILNERYLIQKAHFPREALILSVVFSNLFHFLISLVLFICLALFLGLFQLSQLFALLFAIFLIIILVIGISLLLATLFVKFRDIKFIIQAIVPLWFYATPVMYTRSLLPEQIRNLIILNPMTGIVELFQSVFMKGIIVIDWTSVIWAFCFSVMTLALGVYLFFKDSQYFDDWL